MLNWSTAVWKQDGKHTFSYESFITMFCWVFDHASEGKIFGLMAAKYALEFRTLAEESGWNEPVLKADFCQEFNADILTKLACQDHEATLDSIIDLVVHLDNLLCSRSHYMLPAFTNTTVETPNPMQIG